MRDLLSAKRIKLTAIRDSDLKKIEFWFNDTKFLRYYDMIPAVPKCKSEVQAVMDSYTDSSEKFLFAVRMIETEEIIGIAGFDDIIWSNGVATLFIGIADKQFISEGFGKETLQMLLDFGFNELNFYRIQLSAIAYNEAAIHLYEISGFIREGTYRNFILRDGERFDLYLYGLLDAEWRKRIEPD
jgi:RimJ/RimL family protein N-acetyltransferase